MLGLTNWAASQLAQNIMFERIEHCKIIIDRDNVEVYVKGRIDELNLS